MFKQNRPPRHQTTSSHLESSMRLVSSSAFLLALVSVRLTAQHPLRHPVDAIEARFARSQPVVSYQLSVDEGDLSAFAVTVRIRNAPDTFRLAMARHPEYDDRFWRYVEGLRVEGPRGTSTITRADSALWRVRAPGGEATVRYRIKLPPSQPRSRSAWVPFLSPTGGLFGGPHSFMYVVGATSAPVHVEVVVPHSWRIATGLEPTSDPRVFFAPSIDVLVESPIFAGQFRDWRFGIDGVPHRVVYWPLPDAASFDTTGFVGSISRIAREAVSLFGRAPWREYTFIIQDGAFGGLEHANSVTLGAPSTSLAQDMSPLLEELAHEFIHAWNLVRIRPVEYRGVDYRAPEPSAGLWFSEGLSMFYADLLLRRAGIRLDDSTRTTHLAGLIARYLSNPGDFRFSAERVSRVAYNAGPGALGDYTANSHLQGELIGAMLDLVIRDATNGRRSIDDVMRLMLERFAGERGFTGRDVERTVANVCGCNVTPFFDAHVRGGNPIDFDRYLRLVGLRTNVTRVRAERGGEPVPDLRAFAWTPENDTVPRLIVTNPSSAWGRAGLHTHDRLLRVNGVRVATPNDFRAALSRLRSGDTVRVDVGRATGPFTATVVMAPFDRPSVRIEELPNATARQRDLRTRWTAGTP
jgi:predicted metalloprotease with PDZ domain